MKIQKGDKATYNARVAARRIPAQRRGSVTEHRVIGLGSKPNHEERAAATKEAFEKTLQGHFKRKFEVHKHDIWEAYEVDKMCVLENANFKVLWSTEQPHPLMTELIQQVAEQEEVPVGMVAQLLEEVLGLRLRPDEMVLEDVTTPPPPQEIKDQITGLDGE